MADSPRLLPCGLEESMTKERERSDDPSTAGIDYQTMNAVFRLQATVSMIACNTDHDAFQTGFFTG